MERSIVLKDGRSVHIRPLRPDDIEKSLAFFAALDPEERRYLRRDVTRREVVVGRIRENDSMEAERLVATYDDEIVADGSFERERFSWGEKIGQHNADRINVRMLRPQIAAREIFRRLGFREEYVLPDHVRDLEGNLQDMILMRCELSMLYKGEGEGEGEADST